MAQQSKGSSTPTKDSGKKGQPSQSKTTSTSASAGNSKGGSKS